VGRGPAIVSTAVRTPAPDGAPTPLKRHDAPPDTGVTDELIAEEVASHGLARRIGFVRRLYEWILGWAETRHAGKALAVNAYTEAIFFPVPADLLLSALCLGQPKRSFRWATVCTLWSVLGGTTAMLLGLAIGKDRVVEVMQWIHLDPQAKLALQYFAQYGFWAVAVAALTPVPYMVFSWVAGFSDVSITSFVLASVLFRPMRFFGVAGMVYWMGPTAKRFLDKYFNLATWILMALLIGAYFALKSLGQFFEV